MAVSNLATSPSGRKVGLRAAAADPSKFHPATQSRALHTFLANMLALASIISYFLLNLLVTYTNRIIVTQTSSPYVLTASHAAASYFSATCPVRWQNANHSAPLSHRTTALNSRLILFSVLFTLNITLSNYTLSLVSLAVHQTIRATAPALTIVISVFLNLSTWSSYSITTYLSLIPIVLGVVLATHGGQYDASTYGLVTTFLGAIFAVLKTIATNVMQTQLGLSSSDLIRHVAPLAMLQSLTMAWYYEEFTRIMHLPRLRTLATGEAWGWQSMGSLGALIVFNALLAAALNSSSFEANRRCGPLSMGVAANMKQVVILLLPFVSGAGTGRASSWHVLVGGLITVAGGIWYAFAQAATKSKRADVAALQKQGSKDETRSQEMV